MDKTMKIKLLLRGPARWLLSLILIGLMWTPARAASAIILDGQFSDWIGQAGVSDLIGDETAPFTDLTGFYFATNSGDPTAYFMAERVGANKPLNLVLHIDTSDDGIYTSSSDRYITLRYNMQGQSSSVDASLYDGTDNFLKVIASNADWGESGREGGSRVEWAVTFADLGITAGQAIRMVLESQQGGSTSDVVAEVQWSPASILGWPLALLILVATAGWLGLKRHRDPLEL